MSSIFHLVYRSHAVATLTDEDISRILKTARDHNLATNLTGLLIFRQRGFMQLLEGAERNVRDLYAKICVDDRHQRVQLMFEAKSEYRIFDKWDMAYLSGALDPSSADTLFDLFESVVAKNTSEKSLILPVLRNFSKSHPALSACLPSDQGIQRSDPSGLAVDIGPQGPHSTG